MFFEGDLQAGVAVAIRDSKVVTCFVRDGGEESTIWEVEFLEDDSVKQLLESRAVLLGMQAGSQEAGFLSAFCPIAKFPTVVAIYNGQLKAYLTAGISKDEFCGKLKAVLEAAPEPKATPEPRIIREGTTAPEAVAIPQPRAVPESVPAEVLPHVQVSPSQPSSSTRAASALPASDSPPVTPPAAGQTPVTAQSSAMQEMLTERGTRLERQKEAQDAAEKQARVEKAEARRKAKEAAQNAEASKNPEKAKHLKYSRQLKKHQIEAQLERERILKQIENDKAERKAMEELRKQAARDAVNELLEAKAPQAKPPRSAPLKVSSQPIECAIQVRLLDGSTVRSRFSAHETLRESVRPWVDRLRVDGDTPYTFKQILTPLPNRTIDILEEEESFQSLGLTPSATLVMVPVHGYTSAYGAGDRGLISKGVSAGYSLVSSGLGLVTGALGSILGFGAAAAPADTESHHEEPVDGPSRSENAPTRASNSGPSSTIRTLRDHRPERDNRQFYNGNQLNFEPNQDDNDKKD